MKKRKQYLKMAPSCFSIGSPQGSENYLKTFPDSLVNGQKTLVLNYNWSCQYDFWDKSRFSYLFNYCNRIVVGA
jgi:hypothetical protein